MLKTLSIIFAVLLFVTVCFAEEVHVVSEMWEDCTNEDGTGLYFEILREIFPEPEYQLKLEIVPYARSVAMVQNKAADLYVASYYAETEGVLYPGKEMFFDADKVVAVYLKGMSFSGQADLTGKTVGWMRGYAYDEYLDVEVKPYEIDNRENGLKMVQHGRLDYFLGAQSDVEKIDAELMEDLEVTHCLNLYLYYAFTDTEKGQELLRVYKEKYPELIESGKMKALFEKWDFDYLW